MGRDARATNLPAKTWWRIIAIGLAYCAILFAVYVARHPIRLGPSRVPEAGGSRFPDTSPDALAVLIVADTNQTAQAPSFSSMPADQAWGNFLLQEVGSFRILAARDLSEEALASVALVIVPEGCEGRLAPEGRRALESFATAGGVAVYERARPDAATVPARAEPPAKASRPAALRTVHVSGCADSMTDAETLDSLRAVPLACPEVASPASDGWESLVEGTSDSAGPIRDVLIAGRRAGEGGAIEVRFPFARHLLAWQQGSCEEDFTIPLRYRAEAGVSFCQPNALVPDRRFLQAQFPHADAFERLLMAAIEWVRPIPRLWYFPYADDGCYAMTHDDENFGDRSTAITEEEARRGVVSTVFVIPDRITSPGIRSMTEMGTEIGLHWWRGWSEEVVRPIGVAGFQPLKKTLSLSEQIARLDRLGAEGRLFSNRVHGLVWDTHYVRDFRRLEAAGIRLDSTYGPAGSGQLGYLFGTGFPFHPIDTNGRPFGLMEVPFVFQDDENWDPGLDERLLAASSRSYHELIVPLYHCTTMRWKPSAELMEGWLASYETARSYRHWVTSLEGYLAFWRARNAAGLARGASPGEFTIAQAPQALDRAPDLALMIPPGVRIEASAAPVPGSRPVALLGRTYTLVPLRAIGPRFRLVRER